jgi:peroxiredoxin
MLFRAAAALAFAGAVMTGAAHAMPEVGKPAPAFTAIDSNGKTHNLSDFRGKTVVLEWTNHDCPYVVKHYATNNMQQLQKDATGNGAVWLTVISSAEGQQGYVKPEKANKLTEDRNAAPTAVLLDPKGTVGRAYDARTTPHMYIIDGEGTLVFMGGIDDRPTTNHADVKGATNYVPVSYTHLTLPTKA